MPASEKAFVEGLAYLTRIPLSTPQIRGLLDQARDAWSAFEPALGRDAGPVNLEELATGSETLLSLFDQLTDLYERSMQMLMD